MGVTYEDFIRVAGRMYTPVDGRRRGWARIGREEEGTSSYRAEPAEEMTIWGHFNKNGVT
jgi:hypothetical protein